VSPLLNEITEKHWSWDTEILIRAVNKGYRVVEVPVIWVQSDETKVRPWTDIRQMSAATFRLWRQLRGKKRNKRLKDKSVSFA
jgi:hypothetical protein